MGGLKIGRIFGIPIKLDWSWFLIFGLITWSLACGLSKYSTGLLPWLIAGLVSLIFFASVLFHELAHSVVALKQKISVNSITLLFLGGVASINKESSQPKGEMVLAAAGPISSLFLAGLFFFLSGQAVQNHWQPLFSAPLLWLFQINLLLALFNILPAYPMDGGRIFRAIIWAIKKDWLKATKIACRLTQWFFYGFLGFALYLLITQGFAALVNVLWFALIGWFISSMAKAGWKQALLQYVFANIKVKERMVPVPDYELRSKNFCNPDDLIIDILPKFSEFKVRVLWVKDGDKFVGALYSSAINRFFEEKIKEIRI